MLFGRSGRTDKTIDRGGWYTGQVDLNHTVTAYSPGSRPPQDRHGMRMPQSLSQTSGMRGLSDHTDPPERKFFDNVTVM